MNPTEILGFFYSCVHPLIIHNWSHSLSSVAQNEDFFYPKKKNGTTSPCGAGEMEPAGHLYHWFNLNDNYWSQTSRLPVAPFQSHFKSAAGDMTQGLSSGWIKDRQRERERVDQAEKKTPNNTLDP